VVRVRRRRLRVVGAFAAIGVGVGVAGLLAASGSARPAAARTTLESVSTTGEQGNRDSYAIGISASGRFVAFYSDATNLVPRDTNKQSDVFVRDRRAGETTRVSVTSSGAQANQSPVEEGGSRAGGISANGRYVVFLSDATNLVPRDSNRAFDIFVHDRVSGKTRRVSVSSAGRQANGPSHEPVISADGRYVAFASSASNLVARDSNGQSDVFVCDRVSGKTQRVSVRSGGRQAHGDSEEPAISANGRYVAFQSDASNLVRHDTNRLVDIFVHDRRTGKTQRVSVSSSGKQSSGSPSGGGSAAPVISANGRYVAFVAGNSDLVPRDTNRVNDVFVHDGVSGKTQRVSVSSAGRQANGDNLALPMISPDGRFVAFASLASNLAAGDRKNTTDVFVRDRVRHRTLLATGTFGNDGSFVGPGAMSADDRYLAISSWATNLAPDASPGAVDVFVRDFGVPLGRSK
jgi:Tol biopolymer transport system component